MRAKGKEKFILAGDIGGTKTNLGLFIPGKTRPVLRLLETYHSLEASGLEDILDLFVGRHKVEIRTACFGIAGPVENGRCEATNLPWVVSESGIRNRYGWPSVMLVNDMAAMAYAVPALTGRELFPLNQARAKKRENIGILAPGTGLGISLLIHDNGKYVAVPTEAGHVDFAASSEMEFALWKYLHRRLGHVSVERVVSGPGLFIIYSWLRYTGKHEEPSWLGDKMEEENPSRAISEAALANKDPLCVKALDIFVSVFGAVAGNLALTGLTRGGIYLGGGISPKIVPKLQEGLFMKGFLDKGRFTGLLHQIPVRVILNDRAALLGAAIYAIHILMRA